MSINYYGDFAEDATVYLPFNTFDSNDPTASVTVSTLIASDIYVHKDGSLTDIVTDGATVVIDFDSITGNHMITIDTSAHADYTTGSEYSVRIEGATVDSGNINAWVGSFSIERSGGVLALLKAGTVKVDLETIKTQAVTAAAGVTINPSVGAATIVPTNTQFEARSLPSADYTIVADLGTVQTADHTAGIADIPTVAEFNARTIVSADYLVAGDTLAGVTLVDTCTINSDMVGTDGANTTVPDPAGTAAALHGTTDGLIGALNNITAQSVWDLASSITLDFGTLLERVYQLFQSRINVVDSTGAAALRTIGNGSDLATWSITDDDTTTIRTEVSWV